MPTTYKRNNDESGRWKQEDLERAINAVKRTSVGISAASRAFGIPSRTLRRRIIRDSYKKNLCPAACLGSAAEMEMVSHIQQKQAAGFALSRKDVQILAFKLAQKLGIKHRFCVAEGRAVKNWFASFMRRHPEISVRNAEGISSAELRK
jgi:transposase-like protein